MNKNYIFYAIYLYILFSIEEWIVHKYFMHSEQDFELSKSHIKHHLQVGTDMSLNSKDNKPHGLFLFWKETLLVFIIGLFSAFLLNKHFNVTKEYVIILTLIGTIYQSSFWNTIHPDIHNVNYHVTLCEGVPGFNFLKYHPLYSWLKKNHIQHHLIKGAKKGNYNITMPFADFLFASYN